VAVIGPPAEAGWEGTTAAAGRAGIGMSVGARVSRPAGVAPLDWSRSADRTYGSDERESSVRGPIPDDDPSPNQAGLASRAP